MKKYYKTISKKYSKAYFNEFKNEIEYEDAEFSTKVEITKLVKQSLINLILYCIIASLCIIISWIVFYFIKDINQDIIGIPLAITISIPFLLFYFIGNYIYAQKGYVDTSKLFKNENELFIEDIKILQEHNSIEIQKAKEWRENHPLEEKCRELIKLNNPNALANILREAGLNL